MGCVKSSALALLILGGATAAIAGTPTIAPEADWDISGGARDVYKARTDGDVTHGGPTIRLFKTDALATGYGTYMRHVDAAPYRGKRVRVSAWIKNSGTTGRADFWARVQAADSPGDGSGLGGHWTALGAASDWAMRQIVLDVPVAAASVEYGVGIAGPGELWLAPWPKLEIVGADVPVSRAFDGEQTAGEWLMTGVGAPDHALARDGEAVRLDPKIADPKRHVHLLRVVPAAPWIGKPIRITFDVKLAAGKSAACVVKVLASPEWTYGGALRSHFKPVEASGDSFTTCELKTESLPAGARWILYGIGTNGAGSAWVRRGAIE